MRTVPPDNTDRIEQALDLAKRKEHKKAFDMLEAIEDDADHGDVMLAKIRVLRSWGKKSTALAVCRYLTGVKPLMTQGWKEYMEVAEDVGAREEALTAVTALMETGGDRNRCLRTAAKYSLELCLFDKASMWAEELTLSEPHRPVGWLLLSESWSGKGRNDLALSFVDRAIHLNPKYASALAHKALILAETEELQSAMAPLRKAFSINPSLTTQKARENPVLMPLLETMLR